MFRADAGMNKMHCFSLYLRIFLKHSIEMKLNYHYVELNVFNDGGSRL